MNKVLCINPFEGSVAPFGDTVANTSSKLHNVAASLNNNSNNNSIASDRRFSDAVVGPHGNSLYLIPAASRYVVKMDLKTVGVFFLFFYFFMIITLLFLK
jgi:hypothetical protein